MCSGVPIRRHVARLPFIARRVKRRPLQRQNRFGVLGLGCLPRRSATEHRNSWRWHKEGRNETAQKHSDNLNFYGGIAGFWNDAAESGGCGRPICAFGALRRQVGLYDDDWRKRERTHRESLREDWTFFRLRPDAACEDGVAGCVPSGGENG